MDQLIPLDRLLFPEPVTAGMNPFVLLSLAYLYRTSNEDVAPILVYQQGDLYWITDGRHRAVASMIAGRKTVLATVTSLPG
jgi:hypothetical protein